MELNKDKPDQYKSNNFIYKGSVYHNRFLPRSHSFKYSLAYFYLNLDDIDNWNITCSHWLFSRSRFRPYRFRRKDYHRPEINNLKDAVIATIYEDTKVRYDKSISIYILTQPRIMGFSFNPVSFYYLYDINNEPLCVLVEINNTPWDERFHYIIHNQLDASEISKQAFPKILCKEFAKEFHVSPFMSMNQNYTWKFTISENEHDIEMFNEENNEIIFKAGMNLLKYELNNKQILIMMLTFPFSSLKAFLAIYWNAMRLKLKGITYYEHPKHQVNHAN